MGITQDGAMQTVGWKRALLSGPLTLALGACSVVGIRTTPMPPYEVLEADGVIEVRQYLPQLIAETFVETVARPQPSGGKDFRRGGNSGFRRLAGYIFGGNESKEGIAMTAPVLQEPRSESIAMTAPVLQEERSDGWWMAFILPEGYTLESAPTPDDPRVTLRELPAKRLATLRYSGWNSPEKMARHEATLRAWLEASGFRPTGPALMASYDPPWALPFLRRNEVQLEVE